MTHIPLVDLKVQYAAIRPEIDAAIGAVLDSAEFINGPAIRQFEDEFAKSCGAKYAVGVASGTAALHLALLACNIGPGDEVITVAHTFAATAEAIVHAHATPVFVDIDPRTYTLNPDGLARAITPRTKGIIPVHLYGQPADMNAILSFASQYGLAVIEDAAQSHGARYRGQPVGALGQVACFSFYPGKNLGAYGDAGAVTTNDPLIAERVASLRDHGRSLGPDGRRAKYEHTAVGYGERLDTLQAAILRAKLPHLQAWNEARRHAARRYDQGLKGVDAVVTPWVSPWAEPVYHQYVIRTAQRDALAESLKRDGIATGIHYPIPLHRQGAFAKLGDPAVALPETEKAAAEILSLPMYPELSELQAQHILASVRRFFDRE